MKLNLPNFMNTKHLFQKHIFQPYVDPTINLSCSEFEANMWKISDFVLEKLVPIVGTSPYPLNEQMLMVAAVCRFKPEYIFEWGTNIGKSARIFYEICQNFKINSVIHSIDLPDEIEHIEHPHSHRGTLVRGKNNVILYQGDGLDTALKIIADIKANKSMIFFLDGDHNYASVYRELSGIAKKIKDPVILVHDTFYQSDESSYNIGPYKAIQSFKENSNHLFIEVNISIGLPGMTLLYPSL